MLDVIPFVTAVDQLADRVRALPQSALRRGAADAVRALAGELAARAQHLEHPGGTPRPLPDVEEFVVGDQLAVAGHDLAEAIRVQGTAADLTAAHQLLIDRASTLR